MGINPLVTRGLKMTWEQQIGSAIEAVGRSDHAASEKHFKIALQFAKQNYSRSDNRLALTLSMLGHVYFCRRDFSRAEVLLSQSLRIHEVADFEGLCTVMDLFALAEIKKANGRPTDACRLYRDTLERLLSSEIGAEPEVAKAKDHFLILFDKAHAQLTEADRQRLSEPFDDSLDADTTSGAQPVTAGDPPCGVSGSHSVSEVWQHQLNTGMAGLSEDQDDERESIVSAYLNLESAYRLAKSLFSDGDVRLIATLKGLADASAKLHMYEQSVSLYQHAISSARTSSNPAATERALKLSLALLHADFDQYKQAKALIESEALEDQTATQGTPLFARLQKVQNKIRIYDSVQGIVEQAQDSEKDGDLDKACRLTNTALSQLRQAFAPDHPEQARVLRYRAKLLRLTGNIEQAEELTQRAERIERSNDANHNDWYKRTEDLPRPQVEGVTV